nr:MAG TPA: hypothetical protein [Herelleviridae sp.]
MLCPSAHSLHGGYKNAGRLACSCCMLLFLIDLG